MSCSLFDKNKGLLRDLSEVGNQGFGAENLYVRNGPRSAVFVFRHYQSCTLFPRVVFGIDLDHDLRFVHQIWLDSGEPIDEIHAAVPYG